MPIHLVPPVALDSEVTQFLDHVALAPRQTHALLTLWPIVASGGGAVSRPYVALRDAMARGVLVVDELDTGARVPQVQVENRGEVAVLVLFGEQIHGAMQNRIANASFLVAAHDRVVIDVSCVEAGRWSRRADARFEATGEVLSSAIRRKMARKVAEASRAGRGFLADQGEVWDEVAGRVSHSRAASKSGAYADYTATRRDDLDDVSAAFHALPEQVGFVASIGGEIVGIEAIGRPEVFAQSFGGLLRAYLIDAIDASLVKQRDAKQAPARRFDAPLAFLAALRKTRSESRLSLGLGGDLRLESADICGCALVAPELVHLTAFPAIS